MGAQNVWARPIEGDLSANEEAVVLIAAIVVTGLILLLSWGRMAWWSLKIAAWYPLPQPVADVASRNWPRAIVLLPLRGSDPLLLECLRGLCRQDYPNFEIGLILDGPEDEAWGPVHAVISEFPQVRIHPQLLTERLETCSLKSSALLQAIRALAPDIEVAAVIDADVMAKPWWLRELVRPLLDDPRIGVVCGLRWFLPDHRNCGSVIRQIWNAAASAQMYALGIPWGGTMAYRVTLLREAGVSATLGRDLCGGRQHRGCAQQTRHETASCPATVDGQHRNNSPRRLLPLHPTSDFQCPHVQSCVATGCVNLLWTGAFLCAGRSGQSSGHAWRVPGDRPSNTLTAGVADHGDHDPPVVYRILPEAAEIAAVICSAPCYGAIPVDFGNDWTLRSSRVFGMHDSPD